MRRRINNLENITHSGLWKFRRDDIIIEEKSQIVLNPERVTLTLYYGLNWMILLEGAVWMEQFTKIIKFRKD